MSTKQLTVSPQQAHVEALRAWRDGARDQATTEMAQRIDVALLQAIEKRAMEAIATVGG